MRLRLGVRNAKRFAAWGFAVSAPLIMMGVISLITSANAFAANPLWSDELDYWRGIYSFSRYGFDTGYSGMYELAPRLGAFSTHGFTPWLWYGWWALIFGWEINSIVVCNAVLTTVGMLLFVVIARPEPLASIKIALLYLLFPYVQLYAATSMTECVNIALLLPYIAALTRYERGQDRRMLALSLFLAAVCTVYRVTYFVLFMPPVALLSKGRSAKRALMYTLAALACAAGLYILSSMFTAPFPDGFMYKLLRSGGVLSAMRMLAGHIRLNLADYFLFTSGNATEDGLRVAYVSLMALCLAGSFFGKRRGAFFMCFTALIVPFAAVIALYEVGVWCDFRTLSPFFFGVIAYLLLRGFRALPCAALCGCAVMTVMLCLSPVGAFTESERFGPFPENAELQQLCELVEFDESAASPFDNSVRMDYILPVAYARLPAGVGIELGFMNQSTVGKSRYMLTPYVNAGWIPGYEIVETNGGGTLMRRIDKQEGL